AASAPQYAPGERAPASVSCSRTLLPLLLLLFVLSSPLVCRRHRRGPPRLRPVPCQPGSRGTATAACPTGRGNLSGELDGARRELQHVGGGGRGGRGAGVVGGGGVLPPLSSSPRDCHGHRHPGGHVGKAVPRLTQLFFEFRR
ncbi:unnamed protein product, partial [Ectocarpus fasciculatus]